MEAGRLIERATQLATRAHQGQMRKDGTTEYITHPIGVGRLLRERGASAEVVAAGLLHDAIEDTDVTAEQIESHFEEHGRRIRELVEGASEPDKTLGWRERKEHTIATVREHDIETQMVIAADKLHNVTTLATDYAKVGAKLWRRFHDSASSRSDQLWYYSAMARELAGTPGAQELAHAVNEIARMSVDDEPGIDACSSAVRKLLECWECGATAHLEGNWKVRSRSWQGRIAAHHLTRGEAVWIDDFPVVAGQPGTRHARFGNGVAISPWFGIVAVAVSEDEVTDLRIEIERASCEARNRSAARPIAIRVMHVDVDPQMPVCGQRDTVRVGADAVGELVARWTAEHGHRSDEDLASARRQCAACLEALTGGDRRTDEGPGARLRAITGAQRMGIRGEHPTTGLSGAYARLFAEIERPSARRTLDYFAHACEAQVKGETARLGWLLARDEMEPAP